MPLILFNKIMKILDIIIRGRPRPAGSKSARVINNKVIIFDVGKNIQWKKQIRDEVIKYYNNNLPLISKTPLRMKLIFHMKRPKKSENKYPITKPDLTKLIRCVEDALIGIVYQDDSLIIEQYCKKTYSKNYSVRIIIEKIDRN